MRRLMFKHSAIIVMCVNGLIIVSTVSLAHYGYAYWSLIYPVLLGEALTVLAFWVLLQFRPRLPKNLLSVVPYYRYGLKVAGANLINFTTSHWPTVIIGSVLGQTATGYFQMASVLARMPMDKIGQIFSVIAFPSFSRIQADTSRTRSVFRRLHTVLYMVTLPMFLGIAVVADELIPLLIGEKWVAIILPVQIMCVVNVFAIGSQLMGMLADGIAKPQVNLIYHTILFVLTPTAMLIAIPFDLNGMLAGWAAVFPLAYLVLVNRVTSLVKMTAGSLIRELLPALLSALLMVIAVMSVRALLRGFGLNSIEILAIEAMTGVAVYAACLIKLDPVRVFDVLTMMTRPR